MAIVSRPHSPADTDAPYVATWTSATFTSRSLSFTFSKSATGSDHHINSLSTLFFLLRCRAQCSTRRQCAPNSMQESQSRDRARSSARRQQHHFQLLRRLSSRRLDTQGRARVGLIAILIMDRIATKLEMHLEERARPRVDYVSGGRGRGRRG